MTAITLTLKPIIQLTEKQFSKLCQANPEAKLELTARGELVIMSPTGGTTRSPHEVQSKKFCSFQSLKRFFYSSS